MHIKNLHHPHLHIAEFTTSLGEAWCVFGDNRSGIDQFIALLSGKLANYSAEIFEPPWQLGILTFQAQQEIFEDELRNDDTDFLDAPDPGTLVREFLPNYQDYSTLLSSFGMAHCLDLGYRQLSSGQARKLLLLRELTGGVKTLLLQNPYDGLDQSSCHELNQTLSQLAREDIELIVTVNTTGDIPAWCNHLALIDSGRLLHYGTKERVSPLIGHALPASPEKIAVITSILQNPETDQTLPREELVFLQDGFAGYGDHLLFSGLNLTIHIDDHTLITGPNGCGKSTLLDIITGDNSKCYANTLRVFGQRRGTGESIWQIKKRMGIVSPALHRDHRIPGSALHVVLSGLFDSIGLYQKVSPSEIRIARQWLSWINLHDKADTPFRRLSFAEQRQVLIARALIKRPKLLILDEPTQGLDDFNRNTFLDLLEKAAEQHLTTILFISHRRDEHRPFFKHQIRLDSFAP